MIFRLPLVVGFGLSDPGQVRDVAPLVDGVVVGSVLARMIYELEGRKDGISRISDFVYRLKKALGPDRQVKAPNRNTTGNSRSLAGWTSAFPP